LARPARQSKLVFDPLEPRLLMSADPLVVDLAALNPGHAENDLLVRLMDETQIVNDTPTVRQQVQVVEHAGTDAERVIAAADPDEISKISILGGPGADRVTIDVASFGDHQVPNVSFDGKGGHDTLIIDSPSAADWFSDGSGSGHVVAGPVHVDFAGIESL